MEQFNSFLTETYNASLVYKNNIDEQLNICLGNVSCDMDSSIGVYILAYYLTHKNNYYSDVGNFDNLYIPVVNCPRGELEARLDIAHHLHSFGIDLKQLVYINDLDFDFYAKINKLNISIIDHNKLDITQSAWDHSVYMIVDHHVDTNAYDGREGLNKQVVFCGSACSMALNLFFENKLEHNLTKELCEFFAPAILLDTENLKPELKGKKWSDVDELACIRIFKLSHMEKFNLLISKKTDRKLNLELGIDLILRKDYKNYYWDNRVMVGISVVFNSFHEIMNAFTLGKLKSALEERAILNKLNYYMIITQVYDSNGNVSREFMIFNSEHSGMEKLSKLFEEKVTFQIGKKKFTGLTKNFCFYLIKDDSISRKKIEPIFKEIFENGLDK